MIRSVDSPKIKSISFLHVFFYLCLCIFIPVFYLRNDFSFFSAIVLVHSHLFNLALTNFGSFVFLSFCIQLFFVLFSTFIRALERFQRACQKFEKHPKERKKDRKIKRKIVTKKEKKKRKRIDFTKQSAIF